MSISLFSNKVKSTFNLKMYSLQFLLTFECSGHQVIVCLHPRILEETTFLSNRKKAFRSDLVNGSTRKRRNPPIYSSKKLYLLHWSNYAKLLNTEVVTQKRK